MLLLHGIAHGAAAGPRLKDSFPDEHAHDSWELGGVRRERRLVVDDVRGREVVAKELADAGNSERGLQAVEELSEPGSRAVAELMQAVVHVWGHGRELGGACHHRKRVAREGAAVVHGGPLLAQVEHGHHLFAAAYAADRHAAADDLSATGYVRRHAVEFLGAAGGDAHADHLIEDQENTVAAGDLSQELQESVPGWNHARRSHDRLNEDGCQIVLVPLDLLLAKLRIVERKQQGIFERSLRDAPHALAHGMVGAAIGLTRRHDAQAGRQGVVRAVKPAAHLGDRGSAGIGAGPPHGEHRGLSAGVAEPQLLDGRHAPADDLGEKALRLVVRGEERAFGQLPFDGFSDGGMIVAQGQSEAGVDEIDIAVAVEVVDVAPLSSVDEEGVVTVVQAASRRAAGDISVRLLERSPGLGPWRSGRCCW